MYKQPAVVQEAIQRAISGEGIGGFDFRKALAEPKALKEAFILEAGEKPIDTFKKMGEFLRSETGAALTPNQQLALFTSVIPSIRGGVKESQQLMALAKRDPSEPIRAEDQALIDEIEAGADKSKAEAIREAEGRRATAKKMQELRTQQTAMPLTLDQIEEQRKYEATLEKAKRVPLEAAPSVFDALNKQILPESFKKIGPAVLDVLSKTPGFFSDVSAPKMDLFKSIFGAPAGAAEAPKTLEEPKPLEEEKPAAALPDMSAIDNAATAAGGAIQSSGDTVAGTIQSGGDAVAGALQSIASKIGAIVIPSPQQAPAQAPAGGGEGVEAIEQQAGGLLSGPGSETSDSIPIRASRGEYVIKASSVRKVGVPFLNTLNAGNFAAGGLVEGGAITSEDDGLIFYEGSIAERERTRLGLGPPSGPGWSIKKGRLKGTASAIAMAAAQARYQPEVGLQFQQQS